MKKSLLLLSCLLFTTILFSQGTAYTLKGGMTIGTQQWNGIDRQPLIKYHAAAAMESVSEDDNFSVFLQLGYHIKGSSLRTRNFFNPNFNLNARDFQFRNLSLILGGKQKFELGPNRAYYLLGVRVDYTLSTNLEAYQEFNERNPAFAIYPFPGGVNKWNYGATAGGGIEFPLSELVSGVLEFTVHPDFSRQYAQPELPNVRNPITGQNTSIPERLISNLTFEISAGIRFWRKVEYID
jgi:hypothetical protein